MNKPERKENSVIIIGRSINGISINGLEYLLDDEGQVKKIVGMKIYGILFFPSVRIRE